MGIKDILAKSKGSTNPHNLVKATVEALVNLRDANEIANIQAFQLIRYLMVNVMKIKIKQIVGLIDLLIKKLFKLLFRRE